MRQKKTDVEKQQRWEKIIREAARSGISVRGFCRQRHLRESQFYWWRHHLEQRRQAPAAGKQGNHSGASFALVSEDPGSLDAGIELVLEGGRRLRIRKGVDEATLRAVLQAMERERC